MLKAKERQVYLLKNNIQYYEWGTKGDDAFIPQLLGITPEDDKSYSEYWMGTHENAPSSILIDEGEKSLSEYIKSDADSLLGKNVVKKFNGQLPFLFKVLSIGSPLSIQAHPNKEQAEMLHHLDPINYLDDNHKPELAIAIDKLELLAGFKTLDEIINFCTEYEEIIEFIGQEQYNNIIEMSNQYDRDKLKELYTAIVNKAYTQKDAFGELLKSLKERFQAHSEGKTEKLFLELYKQYGTDAGLITMLFMNHLSLKPGEAIYTKAGIPHAYLSGNIIECMANSDNVIRAGITKKYVDIKNLLKILNFETGTITPVAPASSKGITEYSFDAEEFKVIKIDCSENNQIKIGKEHLPSILLLVDGSADLIWKNGAKKLSKADSVFLPADLNALKIESTDAVAYLASVNLSRKFLK